MKYLVLLSVFLSAAAMAQKSDMEFCEEESSVAKEIMAARQADMHIAETMKALADDDARRSYVLAAYDIPVMATDQAREKAIKEFSNRIFSTCYKVVSRM